MGLHLYSGDNRELGHRAVTVPPRSRVQINRVLRALGADDCRDCRLEFVNEDGGRGVVVHGSVIDNRSGDAVYLPPMLIEY
ncbi:MAG: hypothetical protein V2I67_16900 [Thermoanaerobaculales bacterium]|jgi:hypothetical protein|nr:hypothetical protein [Thermoanaerobaculales bacterium]